MQLTAGAAVSERMKFFKASKEGDESTVKRGLEKQPPFDLSTVDADGRTALHWAVWFKHEAVVTLFLAQHPPNAVDVNARGKDGWTVLHWAAAVNAGARIICKLLAHAHSKADVTAVTADGASVLHIITDRTGASSTDRYKTEAEAVEWLLFWIQHGAVLSSKHEGLTPAEYASAHQLTTVTALLRSCANGPVCTLPEHSRLQGRVTELEAQLLELDEQGGDSKQTSASSPATVKQLIVERDHAVAEQTHLRALLSEQQTKFQSLSTSLEKLRSDYLRLELEKMQQARELEELRQDLQQRLEEAVNVLFRGSSRVIVSKPPQAEVLGHVRYTNELEVKTWVELYDALDASTLGADSVNHFLGRLLTICPNDPTLNGLVNNGPPKMLSGLKLQLKQWLINQSGSMNFEVAAQAWVGPKKQHGIGRGGSKQ